MSEPTGELRPQLNSVNIDVSQARIASLKDQKLNTMRIAYDLSSTDS
jgi:hypothetical protein